MADRPLIAHIPKVVDFHMTENGETKAKHVPDQFLLGYKRRPTSKMDHEVIQTKGSIWKFRMAPPHFRLIVVIAETELFTNSSKNLRNAPAGLSVFRSSEGNAQSRRPSAFVAPDSR
jgi:hypothetical protein